jgi:hypothetical protein
LTGRWKEHRFHLTDDLGDPSVNPYELGKRFIYRPRWTAGHFGVQRDIVKAMCIDSGEELRGAWKAIVNHGGPEAQPKAMALLERMPDRPEVLNWATALEVGKRHDPVDALREWTVFFRTSYKEARQEAGG